MKFIKYLFKNKKRTEKVLKAVFLLIFAGYATIVHADGEKFETNLKLNTNNAYPLAIEKKTTEVETGLAQADISKLNETADPELIKAYIKTKGEEYGVDWKLVYAIGAYESGNYKSNLAQRNNNYFGRKATSTTWMQWDTPQEGIDNQFEYLKTRYIERGMDTPAEMNAVYCEGDTWKYKVQSIMDSV